jgi:superfamily II DNA or RNA helicase
MSSVALTNEFLAKIAGWDVVKQARSLLASGKVLSSEWNPPVLRGVVQDGTTSYRCGLVIKDSIDIENLCTCRQSRAWGTICAHSVAVGLHHLRTLNPLPASTASRVGSPVQPTSSNALPSGSPAKTFRRIQRSDEGQPLEMFVILPPNFGQALTKGKVMVYFEGEWSKGRTPVQALPLNVPFALDERDRRLLDVLEGLAGDTPGMLMVSHADLSRVLRTIAGHPRVSIGKSQPIEIAAEPARLKIKATLEASGEITLKLLSHVEADSLIKGAEIWTFAQNKIQALYLPQGTEDLLRGPLKLERSRIPIFLSQHWPTLLEKCDVEANFKIEDFSVVTATPEVRLSLAGGIAHLQAQLEFRYGGRSIIAGTSSQNEAVWLPDPNSPIRYTTRDLEGERSAQARLIRSGFTGPHQEGLFQLAGQNQVLTFFAREYPGLQKAWAVHLEERLQQSTSKNLERIEPQFEITPSGEQWFDVDVAFKTTAGERFSQADIQRLILSGQNHTRLTNGKFALIDTGAVEELQEVLLDCSPQQHDQRYRIHNQQAGFLASAFKDQQTWKINAPQQWREKALATRGEVKFTAPPLGPLESVLRPYQKEGVGWLAFLRQNHFGGILADEMGLGKTLQTLAFLKHIKETVLQGNRLPHLIVCPTSLVFNWIAEAQKFTPDLRVLALHGPKRHELFSEIPQADLAITSYGLIRRDGENYAELEFDTVVLDEAQHIKNRQTQNAQAVKAVRGRNRLVLTGTPIENSVLDLWSIFDFLMPGYLGSAADFKERYEIPISREKSAEAQVRLSRRVRPFLLRRLKQEVAKDLPEKIEQVSFCELTEDQQAVYQQLLEASRQEITNSVDTQGFQKSRMIILSALLRLRQICCDLRLLKLENTDPEKSSAKLDLFNELLQESIDGGHRVLVFSQFVQMLTLLKERLGEQSIPFCYLDGATTDRAKVVHEFQTKSDIPVFLISLKAGGVGLNLTGADTVIHYDPWWNPAVEAQATDRAHRIGQTKVVTSYKLITRGTVEEKILNLQNRKREMIAATLGSEEQFTSALTWDEMRSLFE